MKNITHTILVTGEKNSHTWRSVIHSIVYRLTVLQRQFHTPWAPNFKDKSQVPISLICFTPLILIALQECTGRSSLILLKLNLWEGFQSSVCKGAHSDHKVHLMPLSWIGWSYFWGSARVKGPHDIRYIQTIVGPWLRRGMTESSENRISWYSSLWPEEAHLLSLLLHTTMI